MDKDDENFEAMDQARGTYMAQVRSEAATMGVRITQWEIEEIEMAFEHGFARGFVAGYQSLRQIAREGHH